MNHKNSKLFGIHLLKYSRRLMSKNKIMEKYNFHFSAYVKKALLWNLCGFKEIKMLWKFYPTTYQISLQLQL